VRDLKADPNRAIDGLLKANKDLDPGLQRASLKATLPLFSPPKGRPYGYQDPGEWNRFADWMTENKLLKNTPDARNAYTNSLLPGAGL
jgi:hypothetical protein